MIGERIKDALKTEKLTDTEAFQTVVEKQTRISQKKVNGKRNGGRKEGEVNIVATQVPK